MILLTRREHGRDSSGGRDEAKPSLVVPKALCQQLVSVGGGSALDQPGRRRSVAKEVLAVYCFAPLAGSGYSTKANEIR
jgi:hypothetical protein